MLIGALKLTHDGSCAVMDGDRLLFSVEYEKINNNKRHARIKQSSEICDILKSNGIDMQDISHWIVDGWHYKGKTIFLDDKNVPVNNYHNELYGEKESLVVEGVHPLLGKYRSYSHIYSHLCSSYCTSPFAKYNDSSFVLVFDGGTKPLLYFYDAEQRAFEYLGELMKIGGDIYASFASRLEPYKDRRTIVDGKEKLDLFFAGKVMAYIAKGKQNSEIYDFCIEKYKTLDGQNNGKWNNWEENRKLELAIVSEFENKYSSADILYNFHLFIQNELISSLKDIIFKFAKKCRRICYGGGSMLNIKWNTAIRNCGLFDEVYAPPFVNDSGAAIGNLCAELMSNGATYLNWNTYMGAALGDDFDSSWSRRKCSVNELASIIANSGEPVVVLNGNAELGPRALGNRSIIADARNLKMKDKLNQLKKRESYRPVAPICIEEDAPAFFKPGTPDKYMLFEHTTSERSNEIPAVFHLDGTARLQTVAKDDNPIIYELLQCYKRITGIPVLCNTSANFLGKGFFPDVRSAQDWGMCKYIWSQGILYENAGNDG